MTIRGISFIPPCSLEHMTYQTWYIIFILQQISFNKFITYENHQPNSHVRWQLPRSLEIWKSVLLGCYKSGWPFGAVVISDGINRYLTYIIMWQFTIRHLLDYMVMFASLIIRLFQFVFSARTVFFSHNKLLETVFQLIFQRSERALILRRMKMLKQHSTP